MKNKKTRLPRDDVIIGKDHRAYGDLELFLIYLAAHPDERLFQALRNWLGCGYIFISNKMSPELIKHCEDTFYWENFAEIKKPKQRKKCVDKEKK